VPKTILVLALLIASPARAQFDHDDFREIIRSATAKVFPAVVYIKVVSETHEQGELKNQESSGSGVLISPDGEVLTNWHVIEDAIEIRCLLSDGRHYDAELLGSDKSLDLALVRLERPEDDQPLPFASFGDSDALTEGDFVMAMGAPWGLNRSVSIGIISCTSRFLEGTSEYSHWLQTDAAISPGNSGGPLVDTRGDVIGINTRGAMAGGDMGFTIPASTIQIVLPSLRANSSVDWTWFGLQLQPLRDFNRDVYFDASEGVIVAETDPGSPARLAGVLAQDRIVAVNGTPISAETHETLPGVRRRLGLLPKETEARFTVMRAGERLDIEIMPRPKGSIEGEELALPRWDFTAKAINQFETPDLHYYRDQGAFVYAVKYPGNAANAGLRARDIILRVGSTPIETLEDLKTAHERAIANVQSQPRLVFTVLRAGAMRQIVLDFSRDFARD